MDARARLNQLKEKFGSSILRADVPNDSRLYVYVDPEALKAICRYVFRDLDARYVISVGADGAPPMINCFRLERSCLVRSA